MKKVIVVSIVLLTLIISNACKKDFIVEDIKNKTLVILAPANNLVTTSNLVTFWWEVLDGAEKYNLQVVKPSFTSLISIVADTNITGTKFNLTLLPGNYQWRIKAINAGGSTAYQQFNLTVDTTSNLSTQLVSVISPQTNYLTAANKIVFNWNSLNTALTYEILLLNSTGGTIKDTVTASTSYTYTFPSSSANYSWKVRAQNNSSISQYNSASTFTIDLTAPAAPSLTTPVHGAIVTPTNNLGWNRVGAPDAKSDSIFIATDSAFTNVISRTRTYQQSILISALNNTPPATSTVYWWKLRSIDSVGNRSVYSSQLKFKLNP
ncbi:MAG: hypothetical protein Q7W45_07885 [Bacteroidota bacterium]|nr:hypothetical protein [Bacteroidota bacterium]MDP3145986.1 hypothetical protein [Bacteroidota bacterium]